jgi:hypothetical protein
MTSPLIGRREREGVPGRLFGAEWKLSAAREVEEAEGLGNGEG